MVSLLALALLYITGYTVCRSQNELIHRKTWNGGWNRHWLTPGIPQPTIEPLPYAPLHIPGNHAYNAAMEESKAEYMAIAFRRKTLGIVFFPMRCLESIGWWVINPRGD